MPDLGSNLERLVAKPEFERQIGPFVLVRQLGRGGFAPVWLAKETFGGETLRAAAVKMFELDERNSSASRRIIAEASALCRVEHPNVVRFYSLALDEDLGLLGLGMEFVAGRSLAARLDHSGPMRPDQVVEVGLAIASALEAVHRAGIVHRDVKPANIMESDQGYKLVDFGISLAASVFPDMTWAPSSDPNCTGRVAALQSGTLGYVDPVMIAVGAPASPTSDLYALGATLFECLTGQLPASTESKTFDERILAGRIPPPPISAFTGQVPSELAAIIDKLVSPDRSQRYASAGEVFGALSRLRARALPSPLPSPLPLPSVPAPPVGRSFFPARSLFPIVAAMIAVLIGAYGLSSQRGPVSENVLSVPVVEAEKQKALAPSAFEPIPAPPDSRASLEVAPDKPSQNRRSPAPARPEPLRAPSATPVAIPSAASSAPAPSIPALLPVSSTSSRAKLLLPPARDW